MRITGKKARSFVNQYNNAPYRTIHDCYKQPSQRKVAAWGYCIRKCGEMDGHNITVLSYNSQTFTAAWYYTHPDTGVLMLHVETAYNSYDMEM